MKATLKPFADCRGLQIGRDIDADDSTMTTNDFPHAFAKIARTTPNIQNALSTRQIELPNCFQSLRDDVRCEIDFFELFRGFTGEFESSHFRLQYSCPG